MFNSTEHEIKTAHKYQNSWNQNEFSVLNHQSQSFILLINVEMQTIVDKCCNLYEQDKVHVQQS